MNIHTLSKFLYGLVGIVFMVIGLGVVLFKSGLLPQSATESILHTTDNNMYGLHLLQEFGALMVFVSLISFWFIRNYQHSLSFHWAMTVFFALLAVVHWTDVRGMQPSLMGPIINTIPVTLFAVVGIIRRGK
jgi:hypothetical protein